MEEVPKTQIPDEVVKMYEIPGHNLISESDLSRYEKDKEQDASIQEVAKLFSIDKVGKVPKDERSSLIRQALESDNPELQLKGVEMIWLAPENEQENLRKIVYQLIKQALNSTDLELQLKGAKMILWAPENEQEDLRKVVSQLIKQALDNIDPRLRLKGVEVIGWAPKNERSSFIRQALENTNPELQIKGTEMIRWAPENERSSLIRQALESTDPELQLKGVEMILWAPENEQEDLRKVVSQLIKQTLERTNPEFQSKGAEVIEWASKNKQEKLRKLLVDKGLLRHLITPSLYENNPEVNTEDFSRRRFNRLGSDITLVGGTLKNKLIIRHINPDAFLTWQRLYEDYELWKEAGFDYVPIEPIQSYQLTKSGVVDVYCGVLDLNLAQYSGLGISQNIELIYSQRDKIKAVLNSINIKHGDTHDGNFCLRFFRDENGEPDITKTPRLYLIDFDSAFSP
jgi:hypothetical protein